MRLLHIADLHLGKSLGDFDLREDQKYILEEILKLCGEQSIDAVLIAGDVYDKAVPSEGAVKLLDWFLRELAARDIKTFMISGNHDSDDRLNYGSSFFENSGIYVSAVFDGSLYKRTLTDAFGEVDIYLLPFVKASQVKHFYPDREIESYEAAVRTVISEAGIDSSRRNILVAHQFVAGHEDPELAGSESDSSVGLVTRISAGCFEPFDYVALGHIHGPQQVGRDTIRYAGSPLKYSLKEINKDKSVPVITIGDKGDIDISLIPLKPLRDVRHIKGDIKTLLAPENISDEDDFIYATLTDEIPPDNAMGILQQVYKNTVKIDFHNSHTCMVDEQDLSNITAEKSFNELINDFYKLFYGQELSDEELRVLNEAAREAGVIDETD